MNKQLSSYLLIIANLIIGLVILVGIQAIYLPTRLPQTVWILLAFLTLNVIYIRVFRLKKEVKAYWSFKKLHYLFIGVFFGIIIQLIPSLAALFVHKSSVGDLFIADITMKDIALTLCICAWEELWFRGVYLNYCITHIKVIPLSVIIGLLFMVIHMLNPEFNILLSGPTLFFAGATLTLLYLYYKNIWLPLGLHFGNNFISAHLSDTFSENIFFGSDGYLPAIILAVIFFIHVSKYIRKQHHSLSFGD